MEVDQSYSQIFYEKFLDSNYYESFNCLCDQCLLEMFHELSRHQWLHVTKVWITF